MLMDIFPHVSRGAPGEDETMVFEIMDKIRNIAKEATIASRVLPLGCSSRWFGTCAAGCLIGCGFNILDFAKHNMTNSTVVTQTQLVITCFLKPPPLTPPPTQVPNLPCPFWQAQLWTLS